VGEERREEGRVRTDPYVVGASVPRQTVAEQGDRLGRSTVVGQGAEFRVADVDLVAVGAVRQAPADVPADADEVVQAPRIDDAAYIVRRRHLQPTVLIARDNRVDKDYACSAVTGSEATACGLAELAPHTQQIWRANPDTGKPALAAVSRPSATALIVGDRRT